MQPQEPNLNAKKFLIIGAITLFLMYGISPTARLLGLDQYQYTPQVRSFAHEIPSYSPDAMRRLIASSNQPVLLEFYASWCPYCRQQAPIIAEFIDAHPDIPARIISVDTSAYKLADYLLAKPSLNFTPYRVSEQDYLGYQELLSEYGIDYQGNIPFIALLAPNKKLVAHFSGVVDKATLEAALNSNNTDQ